MGHRTLSLGLVLRALFLQPEAFDELRDDDNPANEGLLLVVLIGAITGLLALVGELGKWAATPRMADVKAVVLDNLLQSFAAQPWWTAASQSPEFLNQFQRYYDLGWQVFPALFGAPDPTRAALNILLWPILGVLGWLLYGLLAHTFARMLGGTGSLNRTLGTTALAATPLLFRGLGIIPFFSIGLALSTWQLICRFIALRSAHRLSWGRAAWATVLPFLVYLIFWIVAAVIGISVLSTAGGR